MKRWSLARSLSRISPWTMLRLVVSLMKVENRYPR